MDFHISHCVGCVTIQIMNLNVVGVTITEIAVDNLSNNKLNCSLI